VWKLFVTFVNEVSLYSRQTELQILENSLKSEISQEIIQFLSLLHSPHRDTVRYSRNAYFTENRLVLFPSALDTLTWCPKWLN
jgi:hypothetical protein